MASGRVSIAWPFLRSGVRPAYPVLIIYLAFVQSPGNVLMSLALRHTVGIIARDRAGKAFKARPS